MTAIAERIRADFPTSDTIALWIVFKAARLFGDNLAEAMAELAIVSSYRHGTFAGNVLDRLYMSDSPSPF